jgi:hypothetical protein
MHDPERQLLHEKVRRQATLVESLRSSVYSRQDPTGDSGLYGTMIAAEAELHELEQQLLALAAAGDPALSPPGSKPPIQQLGLLGPKTTAIQVETHLRMQPLPTGIYHLLDPETEPLFEVAVTNLTSHPRRVRVTGYLEGLSAQAVKTIELEKKGRKEGQARFAMHPTLLPDRARAVTEVQWATLHVIVDILGGTEEQQSIIPVLCESHNTFPIVCLARTSSFNAVRRPDTGERVDLTHYYGAWVTPYVDAVQERIRPGLTHHNSEAGLYGKFRIPNKLKLLPYSLATFR